MLNEQLAASGCTNINDLQNATHGTPGYALMCSLQNSEDPPGAPAPKGP
jgi:hypothetical protein